MHYKAALNYHFSAWYTSILSAKASPRGTRGISKMSIQSYPKVLWKKMASYARALLLVSVFLFFTSSLGIPVVKPMDKDKPTRKDALHGNIVGLDEEEYKRYVEELRRSSAKRFEELRNKTPDEAVRTVDRKIAYSEEDIRSRLEEAKRQVVEQLRALGRLRQLKDENLPISDHELQALSLHGVSKDITKEDLDKLMHEVGYKTLI